MMKDKQVTEAAILDTIIDFFKTKQWEFSTAEHDPFLLRTHYKSENGEWGFYIHFLPETEALVCYSVFPVDAPKNRRQDMLELVAQLNIQLVFGNFDIDLNDGEVVFKTSLMLAQNELTEANLQNVVSANLQTMSQCIRGMLLVLYEKCTIEDALLLINL